MGIDKEDIAAIVSRMDAQTVIMIELLAELSGRDVEDFNDRYTERYDKLAKKIRKEIIGED